MATKERKIRRSERPVALHTVVMEDSEMAGTSLPPGGPLARILAAGVIALVVAMGIGRFAYTPILPFMQARFGLSNAAIGALASSNYLGYLGGALLTAFVPPGRARDSLLRASLWTVAASTILMGLTADYPAWFALRFVAGVAGAGVFVLGSAAVLDEVSRRGRPGLSGVLYSGPGIGIALSGLTVLALNGLLGGDDEAWRAGWLVLGTLALALVFPCLAWLPSSEVARRNPAIPGDETFPAGTEVRSAERVPTGAPNGVRAGAALALALLGLAYFLEGIGYIVTGTFLPAIVEGLPGLGGLGAGAWILVGLAAVPCTVVWGWIAARVGALAATGAALALQAFGILLPALSPAWWAATGSAVLFGGTFTGITGMALTYARGLAGASGGGLAIGLLTAVFGVGQVLGPLLAAQVAGESGGFGPALFAASGAVALGGLLMPAVALAEVLGSKNAKVYANGVERRKER
jgi:MFS family permease